MKWTNEKIDSLKRHILAGLSRNDISHAMGLNFNQVSDAIARFDLKIAHEQYRKIDIPSAINKVISVIKEIDIEKLPSIKMPKVDKGSGDEEEAILMLSDWQLGHKTISFNLDVAKKRVEKLIIGVFKIIALHRNSYPINKINIFLEGDNIQSEDTQWKVDLSELEMILIDQIFKGAVPLLSWVIDECAKNFEEVNVWCVRGNHGRGVKGSSEKSNFDDIIYFVLQERFSNNTRIKFHIAREFYQVAMIKGHSFLMAHGDQVRGGSYGIPLYALLQRMLRWGTSMPIKWEYLCVGHWHTFGNVEQNGQELFVNGTLVSDDEFVRKTYGWNSSTSQILVGVHHSRGVTWRYKLNLL